MAFALWVDQELAWAEGTHEYRPMGVAVVAITDLFASRDFTPRRKAPPREDVRFAGLFASLVDVNDYLQAKRGDIKTRIVPNMLLTGRL
jgi:hypothetical protein